MIANKEIFLLFVVNIISGVGYSLVAPLYPSIAFKRGLTEFVIGIIISIFAIANLFITPFAHLFFKRFGKKRIFIYAIGAEVIT
jgi:predicted MFS family arabinose efflux permease